MSKRVDALRKTLPLAVLVLVLFSSACRFSGKSGKGPASTSETVTLPASSPDGVPGAEVIQIVESGPPARLAISSPPPSEAGSCLAISLSVLAESGNLASPSDGNELFSLSGLPTNSVYVDSSCSRFAPDNSVVSDGLGQKATFFLKSQVAFSRVITVTGRGIKGQFAFSALPGKPSSLGFVLPLSFSENDCVKGSVFVLDGSDNVTQTAHRFTGRILFDGLSGASSFSDPQCRTSLSTLDFTVGSSSSSFFLSSPRGAGVVIVQPPIGLEEASASITVLPGQSPQLAMVGISHQVMAGRCVPARIELLDADSASIKTRAPVGITLVSRTTQLGLFSDSACAQAVADRTITVPAESSHASFFVRSDVAHTALLSASATGFVSAAAGFEIVAAKPVLITVESTPETIRADDCVTLVVRSKDSFGNVAPVISALPIVISATGNAAAGAQFFPGGSCATSQSRVLTIAIGSRLAALSFKAANPGMLTIGLVPDGMSGTQASTTIVAVTSGTNGADENPRLSLAGPSSVPAGQCSKMSVVALDTSGVALVLKDDLTVTVKTDQDLPSFFFLDSGCSSAMTNLAIQGGTRSSDFFIRSTKANAVLLSALAVHPDGTKTSASKGVVIRPQIPSRQELSSFGTGSFAKVCTGPLVVRFFDEFSNPAPVEADTRFGFESTGETELKFFKDSLCTQGVTDMSVAAGRKEMAFFVRTATRGPVGLSLSASGFESALAQGEFGEPPALHLAVSGPTTAFAGDCTRHLVALLDSESSPRLLERQVVTLGVTGSSQDILFSDDGCTTLLVEKQVVLDTGSNPAQFFIRHTIEENVTVSATASGFVQSSGTALDIFPAAPAKVLFFSNGAGRFPAGLCAGPYAVELQDTFGNSSPTRSILPLSIQGGGISGTRFFSDNSCATSGGAIASGKATGSFFIRAPGPGVLSVTASGKNLAPASREFLVVTDGTVQIELFSKEIALLDFGKVPQGKTGGLSVTVSNTSRSSLAEAIAVTATGGSFALQPANGDSACATLANLSLGPNESCTFSVFFAPTASGTSTGELNYSFSLGGGARQNGKAVALSGTGVEPALAVLVVSVSKIDFGKVNVGQKLTQTFSIENRGTQSASQIGAIGIAAPFSVALCEALKPGERCTVDVLVAPTSGGGASQTLKFSFSSGNTTQIAPTTVALAVESVSPAKLTLTTDRIEFPTTANGQTSQPVSVSVANTGGAEATEVTVSLSGSHFVLSGNNCDTVSVNGACSVGIAFQPKASGSYAATMTIGYQSAGSSFSLTAQIAGQSASSPRLTIDPTTLVFDPAAVGSFAPEIPILVTNTGGADAQKTELRVVSGDPFTLSKSTCGTLAPNQSCLVRVGFKPKLPGPFKDTLTGSCGSDVTGCEGTKAFLVAETLAESAMVVSPGAVDFGTVMVGKLSAKAVTFTNTGASPVSLSQSELPATSSSFSISHGCPSQLAGGSSCQETVTFSPSDQGLLSAALVLGWNAGSGVKDASIPLSGNGLASGDLLVSPGVINFGSHRVNVTTSEKRIVLQNQGRERAIGITVTLAAGVFQMASSTCGAEPFFLDAGKQCEVGIFFRPTGIDTFSQTVHVTYMTESHGTSPRGGGVISLVGVGVGTGSLAAEPSQLDFGSTPVGTKTSQTLRLKNTGQGPVSGIAYSREVSSPFSVLTPLCTQIAAGEECAIVIAFSPTEVGNPSGIVVIRYDGDRAIAVPIKGSTGGTVSATPGSLDFGDVTVGASQTRALTLANSGALPLFFSRIVVDGNASGVSFDSSGCATTLQPGTRCQITFGFKPSFAGSALSGSAQVHFTDSDNRSIASVGISLTGSGVANAKLVFVPSSLKFEGVAVGTEKLMPFSIRNEGGAAAMDLAWSSLQSMFVLDKGSCASGIEAAEKCQGSIMFRPSVAGTTAQNLMISYATGSATATVGLSLVGQAIGSGKLTLSHSAFDFGSVSVGRSKSLVVTLTNAGGGSISEIEYSKPPNDGFTSGAPCSSLQPGASCQVVVTFSPTFPKEYMDTALVSYFDGLATQRASIFMKGDTGSDVSVTPTQVNFGSTTAGQTSAPKQLVLTNVGTTSLRLGALLFDGSATPRNGFALSHSTCGALAPGKTCSLYITFTPAADNSNYSTVLTIPFNDSATNVAATSVNVLLTGSGVSAGNLVASSVNFGTINVGQIVRGSVVVTNNGGSMVTLLEVKAYVAPPFFTSSNGCYAGLVLSPAKSCAIDYSFQPTAAGSYSTRASIVYNGGSITPSLSAIAIQPVARLVLTPGSPFNLFAGVGNSHGGAFVISNSGGASLTLTSLQLTQAPNRNFARLTTDCCTGLAPAGGACNATIAGGSYCRATVTFSPSQTYSGEYAIMASTSDGQTAATKGSLSATPSLVPVIAGVSTYVGSPGSSVVITGSNFSGAAVKFNVTRASVVYVTATEIKTYVPPGATSGPITITTPHGSASTANFSVTSLLPVITHLSPDRGGIGTAVRIFGTNLTNSRYVWFGGVAAVGAQNISSTEIRVTVPSGAVTGPIKLQTPGGETTSAARFTVTGTLPIIASFSPSSGPVGTVVNMSGYGLQTATGVYFASARAIPLSVAPTAISAVVPLGAQTGRIRVVTTHAGEAVSAESFTVTGIPPRIGSFSPTYGPVGTRVTITGAYLSTVRDVRFNGVAADFGNQTATSVVAIVPAGATTGRIGVATSAGEGLSLTDFIVTDLNIAWRLVTGSTNFQSYPIYGQRTDDEQIYAPGAYPYGTGGSYPMTFATLSLEQQGVPYAIVESVTTSSPMFPIINNGCTIGTKIGSCSVTVYCRPYGADLYANRYYTGTLKATFSNTSQIATWPLTCRSYYTVMPLSPTPMPASPRVMP